MPAKGMGEKKKNGRNKGKEKKFKEAINICLSKMASGGKK
jgi:hypothetical protein